MKRVWAIMFFAALLAGCRSSQPTTNPFMQTTVPPPGTSGVVVTPGQPYAAGITPPMVTQPAPPVVTQPVPVTPAPAPMAAPPPPVTPQGDRFNPPGGSYLYHQSSNQRGQPPPSTNPVALASATAPAASPAVAGAPATVQQAGNIEPRYAQPAAPTTTIAMHGAPQQTSAVTVNANGGNTIRIVGSATPAPAGTAAEASHAQPALRMTVGPPSGTMQSTLHDPAAQPTAQLTMTTSGGTATTANFAGAAPGNVVAAAFRPAASTAASDYAHSADYAALRGRLEYLQSSRQWKLRYIPIDGQTDQYGGSVVLADSPALAAFQPGDFVAVAGSLAVGGAVSGYAPHYQLASIQLLSR